MINVISLQLEKLGQVLPDPVEATVNSQASHLVISALFLLLFILAVSL